MRSQTTNDQTSSTAIKEITTTKLQDMQRFAELGRLSASLLHEISNPLTAALLQLDQYKDQSSAGVKKAARSIKTLARYVEAARQQIRQESPIKDFKVSSQVQQLKQIVSPLAKQMGVHLSFKCSSDAKIHGDPVKFQQILTNLIVNAIEAYIDDITPTQDRPVYVNFLPNDKLLVIQVIDWGKGIAPDQLRRIFEAFYTTKSISGHGLGIGLSIVRKYVIDDFSGKISVRSSTRHGTVFTVKLPTC